MSDNIVEIIENINILEITSSTESDTTSVEIVQSGIVNIELSTSVALLPSTFEDNTKIIIGETLIGESGIIIGPLVSGTIVVSTSGLQPEGNYSLQGHTHNSSDINDFASSVSGLLPVKDIISGSGISILNNSGNFTIAVTGTFGLTSEDVDDRIGNLLVGGSNIVIDYDDLNNQLTISTSGLQPSGNYSVVGHSHISSDISDFNNSVSGLLPVKNISAGSGIGIVNSSGDFTVSVTGQFGLTSEQVDDRVNTLLKSGSYINLNYDDNLDSLTISVTGVQPSGNYSLVGHGHNISDINNLQTELDNKQPSGIYASGIHYHIVSDISDFNSAVSGLIPPSNFTSLSGLSGISVSNSGTNYYVSLSDPLIQLSDITDLSANSRTFLLTPSSDNLQSLITDETGSGFIVFNNSPNFSGVPTVPTAPSGTNSTQIANTAFVRTEISNLIDSAPSTLDTLNELAAALGDDANFATTIASGLGQKANIIHSHTVSDITDFNSGVSGLLPITDITGGSYVGVSQSGTIYNISVTGLQPSGNYANSIHSHVVNDISDFTSGVSGLLPSVSGSGYVNSSFTNNIYTISVNGLQPSGNYANASHTHTVSDISDFNTGVSGLLPTVANSGDNRILTSTGSSVGVNAENNLTFDGSTLNVDGNLVFDSFTESIVAIGNSSTAVTLSLSSGTVQTCTLTNNCVFTMPTPVAGKSFTLFLNTGAGSYTASFTSVLWNDSSPPTITTTASKIDILSFISDGIYWYGNYSQNYGS